MFLVILTPKSDSRPNEADWPVSVLLKSQPFGRLDFILAAHQWCALCYKYYLFFPLLTDTIGHANEYQSLHSPQKV